MEFSINHKCGNKPDKEFECCHEGRLHKLSCEAMEMCFNEEKKDDGPNIVRRWKVLHRDA